MTVSARLETALALLMQKFDETDAVVALAGSSLLAVLGADIEPQDIDLTCHSGMRPEVAAALNDGGIVEMPLPGSQWQNSWWFRSTIAGVPVDVTGGPAIEIEGRRVDLTPVSPLQVVVGRTRVRLADPAEWVYVYREIDPEKADMLAALLDPAEVAAAATRLGLDAPYTPATE